MIIIIETGKKKLSWGSYRSISFFKFNILILERIIKEMVTMQKEKDKHSAQIRYGLLHRRKSGFRNTGSWNLLLSRNNNLGSKIFFNHKSSEVKSEVQNNNSKSSS